MRDLESDLSTGQIAQEDLKSDEVDVPLADLLVDFIQEVPASELYLIPEVLECIPIGLQRSLESRVQLCELWILRTNPLHRFLDFLHALDEVQRELGASSNRRCAD